MTHLTTEQIEAMPRTYLDTLTRKLAAAQEGHNTMTQFADDFEITQDQADAINARIAAGEEYAELYGDINEHRAEPTGEEAHTMQTTTTTNEERRLTLGLTAKLTKKEQKEYDQLTAAHDLARIIQPGDTVYVSQRHVSRSGMKRILTLHVIATDHNGKPALRDITRTAATAMQWNMSRGGQPWGIVVNGCGMDMHFHTVYTLARVLFGDGYALTHETL